MLIILVVLKLTLSDAKKVFPGSPVGATTEDVKYHLPLLEASLPPKPEVPEVPELPLPAEAVIPVTVTTVPSLLYNSKVLEPEKYVPPVSSTP